MNRVLPAVSAIAVLLAGHEVVRAQSQTQAEPQIVERTVKALANKDTQIGVYINVRPDCTAGADGGEVEHEGVVRRQTGRRLVWRACDDKSWKDADGIGVNTKLLT
jgi:hypothetical protein